MQAEGLADEGNQEKFIQSPTKKKDFNQKKVIKQFYKNYKGQKKKYFF